ncbi:MAG TPA: flavodoxin family protein [Candidatus Omnitrophota bacterium]|nr:flavodoxin family protein [Candidatus Omnitrophota bacterium]HPD84923.1 flavodoxin family protein [Candidatus Omnitrophota bacterium]HRZ03781.1 flavodoxin family protein [Candidatus Omnitrophota bacterium]
MTKKIIAIIGSYRKNGITEQIADAVLEGAREKGAQIEKVYLLDKHIEFCTNCRSCCKENLAAKRAACIIKDDMGELLDKIDAADGVILASPINFYTITALMKRFVERLIVYAYWPWEQAAPKPRVKKSPDKRAIVVTSSACPAIVGRFLMPSALTILKVSAETFGAKVVKNIYFGMVNQSEQQKLNQRQISLAQSAGRTLA